MARPKDNYEPKKKELLKIALELFINRGYENTTITQIMKAAGLTKAGMYHYFSSKEEILDEAIRSIVEQDNNNLLLDIQGLDAEEKMLRFIKGNAIPSNLMRQLLKIKQNDDSSIAAYRIRECTIHASVPIMEDIILEGIEQGIYQIDFPRQTAEFLILLGKALVEPRILPAADHDENQSRVLAYVQLIEKWLTPPEKHLTDMRAVFFEDIVGENISEKE